MSVFAILTEIGALEFWRKPVRSFFYDAFYIGSHVDMLGSHRNFNVDGIFNIDGLQEASFCYFEIDLWLPVGLACRLGLNQTKPL